MSPDLQLTVNKVGKRFGRQWVIRDFSERFSTGEIVGIRGRNGSGKSTLLRLLCSQLTPSRGVVNWELGRRAVAVGDRYQYVSWTGPYTEIIEELSILELLEFHFGLKPLAERLTVNDVIDRIGLTAVKDRALYDCSSGMRQRVLLATALYAATPATNPGRAYGHPGRTSKIVVSSRAYGDKKRTAGHHCQ